MKALVLTFDRNHFFAENMISSYIDKWPKTPFVFFVPFQKNSEDLKNRFGHRVCMVPSPPQILETIKTLLGLIGDEEWVYWAVDDRFLYSLDKELTERFYFSLNSEDWAGVDGISLCRAGRVWQSRFVEKKSTMQFLEKEFYRRKDYSQIWVHQFVRGKVLKQLFFNMPDTIARAKDMDHLKDQIPLPSSYKLYVTRESHMLFKESSTRGKVTRSAVKHLEQRGLSVPTGLDVDMQFDKLIGKKPLSVIAGFDLRRLVPKTAKELIRAL